MSRNQQIVDEFIKKHKLETTPEMRVLDLISEVGEVSKELLKSSDYGKKELTISDELTSELGDVYFSLLDLATSLNIDLDKALEIVIQKYNSRISKYGDPGSGK